MKSWILTRPLMDALPNPGADYFCDNHPGLLSVLGYIKHNSTESVLRLPLSLPGSLSPDILLALSLPV